MVKPARTKAPRKAGATKRLRRKPVGAVKAAGRKTPTKAGVPGGSRRKPAGTAGPARKKGPGKVGVGTAPRRNPVGTEPPVRKKGAKMVGASGTARGKARSPRPSPARARRTASRATLRAPEIPILYEDKNVLVVEKPAGIPTVSPRTKAVPSVWSLLRKMLRERAGSSGRERGKDTNQESLYLIHRLDQPASGLLLFARTERARDGLKAALAERKIDRRYAAVTIGTPVDPSGEIVSRLVEMGGVKPKVRSLKVGDSPALITKSRGAVTRYRVLTTRGSLAALELELQTGRKHQIRVHLAESGYPVLGDRLYGGKRNESLRADRLMLHAWVLRFQHPVTRRKLEFVSPPGEEFEKALPGAFRTS